MQVVLEGQQPQPELACAQIIYVHPSPQAITSLNRVIAADKSKKKTLTRKLYQKFPTGALTTPPLSQTQGQSKYVIFGGDVQPGDLLLTSEDMTFLADTCGNVSEGTPCVFTKLMYTGRIYVTPPGYMHGVINLRL